VSVVTSRRDIPGHENNTMSMHSAPKRWTSNCRKVLHSVIRTKKFIKNIVPESRDINDVQKIELVTQETDIVLVKVSANIQSGLRICVKKAIQTVNYVLSDGCINFIIQTGRNVDAQ
jgi:hypothetical protein